MQKKSIAMVLLSIGFVLFLAPIANITGKAIARESTIDSTYYLIGFALTLLGILIGINSIDKSTEYSPHSAMQYKRLKEYLNRKASEGKAEEIVRYHAYPLDKGFNKGYLDLSRSKEGFYFSETPEDAKDEVHMRHGTPYSKIGVVKIKIDKSVYSSGLVKKIFTHRGEADEVKPKDFPTFNRLMAKGKIRIE